MVIVELTKALGPDEFETPSLSRRDTLRRLGALGLVAAGGLALAPLVSEAKGHGKRKGRGKNQNQEGDERDSASATAEGAARGGKRHGKGVGAEVTIPDMDDPAIFALPGRTKILSIGSLSLANTRQVTAQGTITFNRELVALMRLGREFRLRCEIWGQDSGCAAPSDLLFKLVKPKEFIVFNKALLSTSTAVLTQNFLFQDTVLTSKLNEDEDTLLDFCNDDQDDIAARLYVETRASSRSTTWHPMSVKVTAEVQGFF